MYLCNHIALLYTIGPGVHIRIFKTMSCQSLLEHEPATVEMYTFAQFVVHAAEISITLQPAFYCAKDKNIHAEMWISKNCVKNGKLIEIPCIM